MENQIANFFLQGLFRIVFRECCDHFSLKFRGVHNWYKLIYFE